MKDAFNKELSVGDKVIYSVKGGGGTEYIVGTIEKLQPCKPKKIQTTIRQTVLLSNRLKAL